jgi:hypothetical protein
MKKFKIQDYFFMNKFRFLLLIATIFLFPSSSYGQSLNLSVNSLNSTEIIAQNPRALSSLESQVLLEINRIRLNPQFYIERLESNKAYYNNNILTFPNQSPIITQEGINGVNEAIEFLKTLKPLPLITLGYDNVANRESSSRVLDRINTYGVTSQRENNPRKAAEMIVMQLIINDGFPERNQRLNLFNPNLILMDLLCGEGSSNNYSCVLSYGGENLTENFRETIITPQSNINIPVNNTPVNNTPVNNDNNNTNICHSEPERDNQENPIIYKESFCIRGSLKQGDKKLDSDNSFYDDYYLYLNQGQSLKINLTSTEFDTFLALQDPNIADPQQQIIAQNDDISENNTNSEIQLTVTKEGVYRIIVNSYNPNSQGEYILTVSF